MGDWPHIAPIVTLIFATLALMLIRLFGRESQNNTPRIIVLLSYVAGLIQISALGTNYWGVSSLGTVRIDGLVTECALAFFCFMLLSQILSWKSKDKVLKQAPIIESLFAVFALILILSNHLALHVFALSGVVFISFYAAHVSVESHPGEGLRSGLLLTLSTTLISSVATVLIYKSTGTFYLDRIREVVTEGKQLDSFYLGWALYLVSLAPLLLLSPLTALEEVFAKTRSWYINLVYRQGLSLVALILICKWIIITSLEWHPGAGFQSLFVFEVSGLNLIITASCLLLVLIGVARESRLLAFLTALTKGYLVTGLLLSALEGGDSFALAQSGIYFYVFLTMLIFSAIDALGLSTEASIYDLKEALQKSRTYTRVGLFVGLAGCAPLFSWFGMDLIKQMLSEGLVREGFERVGLFINIVILILISLVVIWRVIEFYYADARRNTDVEEGNFWSAVWVYSLSVIFLFLGIYPTPLYKYLNHSLRLFLDNV